MSDLSGPDPLDLTACLVRTLVLYTLAEFHSGHATTIRVHAKGASFSVEDDGRGHAIERTIGGSPYLRFVYTHFDYPFHATDNSPIQLHGIGMTLVNTLCSELVVAVRKREAMLRLTFRNGQLSREELLAAASDETGTAISGTVRPQLQHVDTEPGHLRHWLRRVRAAHPSLKLYFNDERVHATHG